jgi:hypothetical protein
VGNAAPSTAAVDLSVAGGGQRGPGMWLVVGNTAPSTATDLPKYAFTDARDH